MNHFFLRREPFGGVLCHVEGGVAKFLNHSGFEICAGLAHGWTEDDVTASIESKFQVDDSASVRLDVKYFKEVLSNPGAWPKGRVAEAVDAPKNPTLSAPLELHWEVTGKCNLRCLHCYNDSVATKPQPSLAQIRSVANELKDAKIKLKGIIVSGGEPLMHPRLKEILELLRPLAMEVVLATNGTLVTEANIEWIAGMTDAVNVSIDSADGNHFDNFRGHADTLNKVIRAIRLFRSCNIPIIAQTTLSRFNIEELDSLARLLIFEGIRSWIVRMPLQVGRAKHNQQAFLTRHEAEAKEELFNSIRSAYAADFDLLHIGNRFMWSYTDEFIRSEANGEVLSCAAGTILATIRADGTMVPCAIFGDTTNSEASSLPVWDGRFLSEWRNAECFKAMREINFSRITPCANCSKFPDVCNAGCRAVAFHAYGSIHEPDPGCNYVRAFRRERPRELSR